jgi:hypothetical protein
LERTTPRPVQVPPIHPNLSLRQARSSRQKETHVTYLRAHRRWAYATGTVLLIGTGAVGAALASGNDGPSPTHAHTVEEALDDHGRVHLPEWRQELNAETVQCFRSVQDGPPQLIVRTKASEFPMSELLTRERLVDECAGGTDAARQVGGFDRDGASTCVSRSAARVSAVVLGGDCGDLITMTDDDLRRLNELRAVEVAMLAVPSATECPTVTEATEWARLQLTEADVEASVSVMDEGDQACYRPVAYWDDAQVLVQALGFQPE